MHLKIELANSSNSKLISEVVAINNDIECLH